MFDKGIKICLSTLVGYALLGYAKSTILLNLDIVAVPELTLLKMEKVQCHFQQKVRWLEKKQANFLVQRKRIVHPSHLFQLSGFNIVANIL